CLTGVRGCDEVYILLFSDIEIENRNCFLNITKGKTKAYSRARIIALSYKALSALLEIARIHNPEKELTIDNFTNIKKPILVASFGQMPCYVKVF
ncbi:hypothetical protein, partial [Psychromonas aquatilis]